MTVTLVPAGPPHAEVLAAMHHICFREPWSAPSMASTLAMPGVAGLIAEDQARGPAGMVLWRVAADEAEILTLLVLPPWRRAGLGRRLMAEALAAAVAQGATAMFLEVAAPNDAAQALYRGLGFTSVGVRKGYYGGTDAVAMRRDIG